MQGRLGAGLVLAALLAMGMPAGAWTPLTVSDDPLVRMPGTQPGSVSLEDPNRCFNCHKAANGVLPPEDWWKGSMMAQAARDFLYWSCLTVAAQDSIWAAGRPNATDICLRCHMPKGWLEGRSDPTNGSAMTGADFDGVMCDFCHASYDPFFEDTYSGVREGSDWLNYWDETNASGTRSDDAADATLAEDRSVSAQESLFNGNAFYDAVTHQPVQSSWTENGGGQYFVSGGGEKRASFADAQAAHSQLYSRYHKSKYFCETCHDVSNPVLQNLAFAATTPGDGTTVLPTEQSMASSYFHVERTFSEFLLSDFGVQGGAPGTGPFAPGVLETSLANDWIARCQDCHMRDDDGKACNKNFGVVRTTSFGSTEHPESGQPQHDLTGGNVWVPTVLASTMSSSPNYDAVNDALLDQGPGVLTLDLSAGDGFDDPQALLDGAGRALANLADAAEIERLRYNRTTGELSFRVRNHTGHKLISGFPEGRRMFVGVRLSAGGSLIQELNPYDAAASTLKGLPGYSYSDTYPDGAPLPAPAPLAPGEQYVDDLVYETHPSSSLTGEAESFHFALADGTAKDNRIPPRGFRIAEAAARGTEPVWEGHSVPYFFTPAEYAGGHDDVWRVVAPGADDVEVTLYYQTTSREYIEFLRDEIDGVGNTLSGTGAGGDPAYLAQTDPWFSQLAAWGETLWKLWKHNRSLAGAAPVTMTSATLDDSADSDGDGVVDVDDVCPAQSNADQADADGDGDGDVCDNCVAVANPSQQDSDADGYGNACDADYNEDGVVGGPDYVQLTIAYGAHYGDPDFSPDCDHNDDGVIGGPDYVQLTIQYGGPPGPSGLACAGTFPCTP
jgi:hypothetical protein